MKFFKKSSGSKYDAVPRTLNGEFSRTRLAEHSPVDYYFDDLFAFRGELDGYVQSILKKNNIDAGNQNFLDNLIEDVVNQTVSDVQKQHAQNTGLIFDLDSSRQGDQRDTELRLEDLKRDLQSTEARLANLISRETGRLQVIKTSKEGRSYVQTETPAKNAA